jgi:hypothetical protein
MGQRFFESTMPKIADQLERLNANLEALVAELRMYRDASCSQVPAPARDEPSSVDGA